MAGSSPLLQQIVQNPLLVALDSEQLFQACVMHVVGHERARDLEAAQRADSNFWPEPDSWEAEYRPYNVMDGVLQIPVMGALLNRFSWQVGRWATGYTYIEQALKRGLADANVKGIAFICHSPGGEVAGCFELVDKIYEARGQKPMRAFAADAAYSAAFAVACSADDIVITRSGGVGSVGVVTAHVDYSGALKDAGIKITYVFAGKHKVDGNPYEKLPDSVKSRWQERIDRMYAVFTSTVARNRAMDDAAVRATEALTYDGQGAIDIGFADRLGALDEEMVIFSDECDGTNGDIEMANDQNNTPAITQAAMDAAVTAARAEGKAEGLKEGQALGATAAKLRITTILSSDVAKERPKAAFAAAMKLDASAEDTIAYLADVPKEQAGTTPGPLKTGTTSAFEQAMDATKNPDITAGGSDDDGTKDTPAARANSILGDYYGAAGIAPKTA